MAGDLAGRYLADVKPGTQDSYQSVCRLYLKPAFGEVPLNSLRAPIIQKMYNQLKEKGLSPKYIKNIHGVLHRALDMAVRLEYLLRNPTCACVIPRAFLFPAIYFPILTVSMAILLFTFSA